MTPEARNYLNQAQEEFDNARKIEAIGLPKVTARAAYYVTFHSAQAFIFETNGRSAKTHSGVRSEFSRLAKDRPDIDPVFPKFMAKAYEIKEIADYSIDPGKNITMAEASGAIAMAARFLECITAVLTARVNRPRVLRMPPGCSRP